MAGKRTKLLAGIHVLTEAEEAQCVFCIARS